MGEGTTGKFEAAGTTEMVTVPCVVLHAKQIFYLKRFRRKSKKKSVKFQSTLHVFGLSTCLLSDNPIVELSDIYNDVRLHPPARIYMHRTRIDHPHGLAI